MLSELEYQSQGLVESHHLTTSLHWLGHSELRNTTTRRLFNATSCPGAQSAKPLPGLGQHDAASARAGRLLPEEKLHEVGRVWNGCHDRVHGGHWETGRGDLWRPKVLHSQCALQGWARESQKFRHVGCGQACYPSILARLQWSLWTSHFVRRRTWVRADWTGLCLRDNSLQGQHMERERMALIV